MDGCVVYYDCLCTGMGIALMDPWTNCNSLRYGFDEDYDIPFFDEEEEADD